MGKIDFDPQEITVETLIDRYRKKQLRLEPVFQRLSVWKGRDRERLIDSILRNYPLPSIFLYRQEEEGEIYYDVIDGKQRIESILMFVGEKRGRFTINSNLPGEEEEREIGWNTLKKEKKQPLINGYKVQITEVSGDLEDIISLFVSINSTGKALTKAEVRNAEYHNRPLLEAARDLSKKHKRYLRKIFSSTQISRMKDVELICELIVSAAEQAVINKKEAVDRAIARDSIKGRDLRKAALETERALKNIEKIFPNLPKTRFQKISDFYSLSVLIQKFARENLVLAENELADDFLVAFSTQVDKINDRHKRLEEISSEEELYRSYLATVRGNSDGLDNRRKREQILRGVLESLFQKKDKERYFSQEQRRILWNSTDERKCAECGTKLRWEDFTIDHINPHSKGGRTALDNAVLMCRSCNSRKGNRRSRLAA